MTEPDMIGPVGRLAVTAARVGESPLWLPERNAWAWLDLQGRSVHLYDPARAEDRIIARDLPEDLACLVRWTPDAALLVSVRGFHRLDIATGAVRPLACPIDLPEGTIFNDGKADRHGSLWIGSSDASEAAPLGRLWRVSGGRVTEIAAGFTVSNGPAFAPDGSAAYFADTFGRRLLRFSLDAAGLPVAQATFVSVPDDAGYPDGMTTDSAGTLYVGHWDGARISRYAPDGATRSPIPVPARNVTSLAFGGKAMCTAAVTTAALFPGQVEAAPPLWNGDLLGFDSPVPGLVEPMLAPDWRG